MKKTTNSNQNGGKVRARVVFRVFRNGEVIALMPDFQERNGDILSYMHIGQHSAADPLIVRDTKPATAQQYAPLLAELRGIGYDVQIRQRLTR